MQDRRARPSRQNEAESRVGQNCIVKNSTVFGQIWDFNYEFYNAKISESRYNASLNTCNTLGILFVFKLVLNNIKLQSLNMEYI